MSIALGAYIADGGLAAPSDPAAFDNYTALVGRPPAIVLWYQTWAEQYNYWSSRVADNCLKHGAMPMITWEPWNGLNPDPIYKLTNITRGDFDAYLTTWATAAMKWGYPFLLRFAHEMNGGWYPWGTKTGNAEGNVASDYVAAWQHVHDLFARVGCTNARWVWSPNVEGFAGYPPMSTIYPGDAYVDWVGLDGYNGAPNTKWQSFPTLFATAYADITTLTQKPLMIAETACGEGDKASWIYQTFLEDIPTLFPRIKAVVWWDKNKEADWRVNSSPAALAAWRDVVADPRYYGAL